MTSKKTEKFISKLLSLENQNQKLMNKIVLRALEEEKSLINKFQEEEKEEQRTFGEKLSDKIASFGGSWNFIIIFFIFLTAWMFISNYQGAKAFDHYPYILLNLILSCLAAIQAPIILMSANRKETRDRKRATEDYMINLKAELESRVINEKIDLLINKQFKDLIEIENIQTEKIDKILNFMKKK